MVLFVVENNQLFILYTESNKNVEREQTKNPVSYQAKQLNLGIIDILIQEIVKKHSC